MAVSFYSREELCKLGFKSVGHNVLISRKASIYGASNMSIGDNVRIDDFVLMSGHITLGSHIHLSAYAALYGGMGIELEDYTGMSPRATIYSAMDDFGGDWLVGPIHPDGTTCVTGGKVTLQSYSHLGCNSVVFPGITVPCGTVIGAMTLVNKPGIEPWTIYAGVPARPLRPRSQKMIQYV